MFSSRIFLCTVLLALCSSIYINEEANDVVQAILKHFDENPQDSRFEQVIFIPSDKCHLFPKVNICEVESLGVRALCLVLAESKKSTFG